jgi:hypothetical protein
MAKGATELVVATVSCRPPTSLTDNDVLPPLIAHANATGVASSNTTAEDATVLNAFTVA